MWAAANLAGMKWAVLVSDELWGGVGLSSCWLVVSFVFLFLAWTSGSSVE